MCDVETTGTGNDSQVPGKKRLVLTHLSTSRPTLKILGHLTVRWDRSPAVPAYTVITPRSRDFLVRSTRFIV